MKAMRERRRIKTGLLVAWTAVACFALFSDNAYSSKDRGFADLDRYRDRYPQEIFDYCEENYLFDPNFRFCLRRQEKIRNNILVHAADQLKSPSHALAVYDECVAFFLLESAAIIGECVETRLILHLKLEEEFVEQFIYEKCDEKWREHSILAIRNCASNSANGFRYKGELPDW